jgi:hypothetical protein
MIYFVVASSPKLFHNVINFYVFVLIVFPIYCIPFVILEHFCGVHFAYVTYNYLSKALIYNHPVRNYSFIKLLYGNLWKYEYFQNLKIPPF